MVNGDRATGLKGTAILQLMWGLVWRIAVGSFLISLVQANVSILNEPSLQIISALLGIFLVCVWLVRFPYGGVQIKSVASSHRVQQEADPRGVIEAIVGMLSTIAAVAYFGIGLVQIWAELSFFTDHLHWSFITGFLASVLTAYIPLLGPILGCYAAVEVWEWPWYWSALLFFFPILIFLLSLLVKTFMGQKSRLVHV